jgi:uncharacterized membrane protein YiaA
MTIFLFAEVIVLLIILGAIYVDRKTDTQYKRRRFYVSFFTLIVVQVIIFLLGLWLAPSFIRSEAHAGYLYIAVFVLSIPATLLFSRWYVNNY